MYSALQTKIAEGQENPLSLIEIAKLYEVQKYVSMTSHMWDGFWMLANTAVVRFDCRKTLQDDRGTRTQPLGSGRTGGHRQAE